MPERNPLQAAGDTITTAIPRDLNGTVTGQLSGGAAPNTPNVVLELSGDDQASWGAIDIVLASLTPTAGAYVQIFLAVSLDGSTYEDAPSSTNPGAHQLVATASITTGAAAKRTMTAFFRLPPCKFKFVLKNATVVALAASGNTCTLKTANEQGV